MPLTSGPSWKIVMVNWQARNMVSRIVLEAFEPCLGQSTFFKNVHLISRVLYIEYIVNQVVQF